MNKKKYYSPEFKKEAVRLAEANGNKSQVARDLGIHATMICKWQRQLQSEGKKAFPGQGKPRDEEMAQLKKENYRLKQEPGRRAVEILKKAATNARLVSLQSAPREIPASVARFIQEHRDQFSVTLLCEVLQVSRSGYYACGRRAGLGEQKANVAYRTSN